MMGNFFRKTSKLCLFLSVLPLFFLDKGKICFGSDEYILSLIEVNGTGGDDDIAFSLLAIFTIVFMLVFSWVSNKIGYAVLFLIYFVCQYLIFLFVESSTVWDMIWSSVAYCNNDALLIWGILQLCFIVGSVLFLFKSDVIS